MKSSVSPSSLRCSQCSLGKLCLPVGLDPGDMHRLEDIIESSKSYKQSESVYRAGDEFRKIYAVKSGLFETVATDANGNEHIIGFHLPGELFGLDAIYSGRYISTPVAVTSSVACSIEYSELSQLATKLPSLQNQLMCLMSKEVHSSHSGVGEYTAEQKIAGFILSLSMRYQQRGYSATRFQLLMPRKDIASYLSMAPETVSRMFRRLVSDGILEIHQTEVNIKDMDHLKAVTGHIPADRVFFSS